jgi:leucyl aminopeptidase
MNGGILNVSRGSKEEPKVVILRYKGGKAEEKPIVLVGKGVTFDSGGISIKPSEKMEDMKYDKSGAATGDSNCICCCQLTSYH